MNKHQQSILADLIMGCIAQMNAQKYFCSAVADGCILVAQQWLRMQGDLGEVEKCRVFDIRKVK